MKNFKLAFTDNTTFYGKDLEGFYANALLTGNSKSEFKLIPNVKSKVKIGQLNLGNILQDADCSFSSTGEGTLAQKTLEVCPVKINLEYCQRTFETDYLSQLLRPGSNNDEIMPASVESFLLAEVAKKVSADTEQIVWKGDSATASYPLAICDGLQKQFKADAKLSVAPGITANYMVAARKSNLLLLTDLVSDFEDVSILPQKSVTGVPVVRMIGEFKFGVNYIYGSEVVFYWV
jgi:hypothetical protein